MDSVLNSGSVLNSQKPGALGSFFSPEKVTMELGLSEGMIVADFGSGAGHFIVPLSHKVGEDGKIFAIDIQESALDNARAKAKSTGLENIETIRADLEVLGGTGIPDNTLDMVLISNTLFQSNKKSEIIREAMRVLKAQGALAIIEWKKGGGGFGPPDELRTDESGMKSLATNEGFVFERDIDAGQFHFGIIFRKQ